MAHHKYLTKGCVLGTRAYGEGNAIVSIMTEDLGLIRAIAQGIRLGKSKLRMSVQECSVGRMSLIKGKDMWRLTNVVDSVLYYPDFKKSGNTVAFNVQTLLERLTPMDEPHPKLFQIMEGLWKRLTEVNPAYHKSLEYIALLNILHELGYLGDEKVWNEFIGVYEPDIVELVLMEELYEQAVVTINHSLNATHL